MGSDKKRQGKQAAPVLPESGGASSLGAVVDQLCHPDALLGRRTQQLCTEPLPSREVMIGVTRTLRAVLFPGYYGTSEITPETISFHVGHALDEIQRTLAVQIKRGLAICCTCDSDCAKLDPQTKEITETFLRRLPAIQQLLAQDVQAAYEGDPAATSTDEAIFCYPGVLAIASHRMAHELYQLAVPLLPRMISEHAHSITGIDIHPGAKIGEHFFIDHGTGVVIGETCVIGNRVRIYQGVTLGAKSFPLDEQGNPIKGIQRHPLIEDDVTIYSGATILGRVTIGKGSVIGGNVWLTEDVPPFSRITLQAPRQESFAEGGGI